MSEKININSDGELALEKKKESLWRNINPRGRKKAYTPTQLWSKAKKYFEWCEENPIKVHKYNTKKGPQYALIDRPFTKKGFCQFANIARETFDTYIRGVDQYADYKEIAGQIADIIYTQKLERGLAGMYQQTVLIRDLGLAEKVKTEGVAMPIVKEYNPYAEELKEKGEFKPELKS